MTKYHVWSRWKTVKKIPWFTRHDYSANSAARRLGWIRRFCSFAYGPADWLNQRAQPLRACKSETRLTKQKTAKCDSAIGQHLLNNPACAQSYADDRFTIVSRARSASHLRFLEATFIRSYDPLLCKQKDFVQVLRLFWTMHGIRRLYYPIYSLISSNL